MKNVSTMIMIAAGALALGSVAYGQTAMTADIPFAFRASGTTMPAGRYQVTERTSSGVVVLQMHNAAAKRNVMAVGGPVDLRREGNARITFQCRSDACYLSQIRNFSGTVTYPGVEKAKHDQLASAISVPLTVAHGE